MTRDEYVKWLKQLDENLKFDGLIDGDKEVDLHEMIFDLCEMLEQQTCEDAISRQVVLSHAERNWGNGHEQPFDYVEVDVIKKLPSVKLDTCEDCISRQAVLDLISKFILEIHTEGGRDLNSHTNDVLRQILRNVGSDRVLPPVTPKPKTGWIPVSERLPEDIKPVIVTWKNTDPKSYYQYIIGKHFIGTAHYKNGAWFWYSSTTEDMLAEYGRCDSEEFDEAIEVVAWMPLPEPYKADGGDTNE